MGSCKVWYCTTQGHCRNVNKNTFSENVKIMVLKWLMLQDQSKYLFVMRLRVTQEAGFRESRLGKTFIYSPRSLDMKSKFSKNWQAAWLQRCTYTISSSHPVVPYHLGWIKPTLALQIYVQQVQDAPSHPNSSLSPRFSLFLTKAHTGMLINTGYHVSGMCGVSQEDL